VNDLSHPAAFLVAVGELLELQPEEDGSRRDAVISELGRSLKMLLRQHAFPAFTFQRGEVEYEGEVLDELHDWKWSLRLPEAGVERLDITPGTTMEDLEGFVEEVAARLFLRRGGASAQEVHGQSSVRFGELDIAEASDGDERLLPPLVFDLDVEAEAIAWLHGEVLEHGVVPGREAASVVRLLAVAMHSERDLVVPLVELKSVDQYTTTHSINVSCLSMALAEHLRYSSTDVRAIGEAALLHDIGKTRIPLDVLNKEGKLTPAEWELIRSHTTEGARILLESGPEMEIAATVAYEHHLSYDGEGYPKLSYRRQTHEVSRLVQVCDVYDALRTRRPFRPPWPADRTLKFLEDKAGTHLDPAYVQAFCCMIADWEPRQVILAGESEAAVA